MEHKSLAELCARSFQRFANRPAVSIAGRSQTYQELFEQALRLNIPDLPENAVCAVWADRDFTSFAAIIGILLRGHTYLPLSPSAPPARNAEILRNSGAKVLVCPHQARAQISPLRVLLPPDFLIVDDEELLPEPAEIVLPRPEDCAYLMYTSGSTGRPRGVKILNSQVMTYLRNASAFAPVNESDRVSQMFDLTFDLSVHDMFMCWGGGGCLFVPTSQERFFPHEFINRNRLTYWFSVPSAVSLISNYGALNPGSLPTVQTSLFCGEALRFSVAEAWRNAAPQSKMFNLYGPTEATVAISQYHFSATSREQMNGIVSIGKIFPEHSYRIVNGELFVSGPQVIQSYPEENPFDGGWYKTGDLVKEENGHLFFLGRTDTQIKLRGYRIELNEIAHAAGSAAGGCAAEALAWPSIEAPQSIYVFIENMNVSEDEVIEKCAHVLPNYMIPSAVFKLTKFPLNDRGKTDRLKLAGELDKLLK